ncbi:hypothetical protein J7K93_08845 [bacterium]|nr:hypothetical protein [bacterium]
MFIKRKTDIKKITEMLELFPVVVALGPRPCGKTTLARQFILSLPEGSVLGA